MARSNIYGMGFSLMVIGGIATFGSLLKDTTVFSSIESYDRIHNNGLMNDRLVYTIVSCSISIVGALLMVIGSISDLQETYLTIQTHKKKAPKPVAPADTQPHKIEPEEII